MINNDIHQLNLENTYIFPNRNPFTSAIRCSTLWNSQFWSILLVKGTASLIKRFQIQGPRNSELPEVSVARGIGLWQMPLRGVCRQVIQWERWAELQEAGKRATSNWVSNNMTVNQNFSEIKVLQPIRGLWNLILGISRVLGDLVLPLILW